MLYNFTVITCDHNTHTFSSHCMYASMQCGGVHDSTVVEHLTSDPEVEGLNPAYLLVPGENGEEKVATTVKCFIVLT
jgi:hypothetical protein